MCTQKVKLHTKINGLVKNIFELFKKISNNVKMGVNGTY